MFTPIWVPEWLYRHLPRAALLAGLAGLLLLNPSLLWVPVSLTCLLYGAAAMAARAWSDVGCCLS